jgi:hypothetical protein
VFCSFAFLLSVEDRLIGSLDVYVPACVTSDRSLESKYTSY